MGISRDKKEAKARSFFWKTKMVFLFSAIGSIFGLAVAVFEIGKKTMEFVVLNRAGALVDFFNLSLELGHFFDGARTAFYFFHATRENPVILSALQKIQIYSVGGALLFFCGAALALTDGGEEPPAPRQPGRGGGGPPTA